MLNRRKKEKKKRVSVFMRFSVHDTLGNGFGHGSFVCLFVWILFVGLREGSGFLMCV
jgi:hypothetical protein